MYDNIDPLYGLAVGSDSKDVQRNYNEKLSVINDAIQNNELKCCCQGHTKSALHNLEQSDTGACELYLFSSQKIAESNGFSFNPFNGDNDGAYALINTNKSHVGFFYQNNDGEWQVIYKHKEHIPKEILEYGWDKAEPYHIRVGTIEAKFIASHGGYMREQWLDHIINHGELMRWARELECSPHERSSLLSAFEESSSHVKNREGNILNDTIAPIEHLDAEISYTVEEISALWVGFESVEQCRTARMSYIKGIAISPTDESKLRHYRAILRILCEAIENNELQIIDDGIKYDEIIARELKLWVQNKFPNRMDWPPFLFPSEEEDNAKTDNHSTENCINSDLHNLEAIKKQLQSASRELADVKTNLKNEKAERDKVKEECGKLKRKLKSMKDNLSAESIRANTTYLNIIGFLYELLSQFPKYKQKQQIIMEATNGSSEYKNIQGLKQRTLDSKLKEGKESLNKDKPKSEVLK